MRRPDEVARRAERLRAFARRDVRDGRIDRIDDSGNIREHRVRDDDPSRTLCGLVIGNSQAPADNRTCARCTRIAKAAK